MVTTRKDYSPCDCCHCELCTHVIESQKQSMNWHSKIVAVVLIGVAFAIPALAVAACSTGRHCSEPCMEMESAVSSSSSGCELHASQACCQVTSEPATPPAEKASVVSPTFVTVLAVAIETPVSSINVVHNTAQHLPDYHSSQSLLCIFLI